MNFSQKTYPPNVAIPHLLVYSRTILVDFLAQKVNYKNFRFCPIVKSMISLYKLNTCGDRPISFHKLWNFGPAFCWYRHNICHRELPSSSIFNGISPGQYSCRCGSYSTAVAGVATVQLQLQMQELQYSAIQCSVYIHSQYSAVRCSVLTVWIQLQELQYSCSFSCGSYSTVKLEVVHTVQLEVNAAVGATVH